MRTKFIQKAKSIHGNKYDYSLVKYINNKTKIKIICPEHGIFEQTPGNHTNLKHICPKCSYTNRNKHKRLKIEDFIKKSRKIHNDKYDYSFVVYKNLRSKVKIVCPIHGIFEQTAGSHIQNHGCPKCKYEKLRSKYNYTAEDFVDISKKIHGNKYDYSLVKYINNKTKIKIICPEHGIFEQTPDGHLNQKNNCPKCSCIISRQEIELQDWIKDFITIETNDRSIISPYELDIVIPEKKIAIEYNGLYWHSEGQGKDRKYHLNKYLDCKDKGYRLITIWENEWVFKQDIVKSIILNAIGIHNQKIHGRKCIIQDISAKEARPFYNDNHIQGFKGGKHKGLYYQNELVSLMTIDARNELQRFVNKKYTIVHGAFSKLLKSFNLNNIYTFADIRYFTGDVYEKNGFNYDKTIPPRFYYTKQLKIFHRRTFQKKNIEKKFKQGELNYYNPDKTEYQNMLINKYDRIWDNGKIKFIQKEV